MPPRKQSIGVLMVLLLLTGVVWAQVSRGTITGIVTDPTGAVVPSVAIVITNIETGVTNKAKTNESGMYTVPLLEGANYRLSAQKAGFKEYEQTDILVQSGGTARIDFSLTLGQPTQSVLVTGTASLLERETSDTQTIVTSREIEDLPLTSFGEQRNPAAFMQLAPGVTGRGASGNLQGGALAGYNRAMTTQVSGSVVGSTTLLLDGADVASRGIAEGDLRGFQIPPDAVGEMKLMATNASAEFGRSAGGGASFEIKTGSNQIHGSAFEFLRNDVLDARNFFQSNVTAYRQNEFGAVAGGPIKKDKAFIFGWYDGFRWTQGVSTGESTVPSAQMLNGDFTQFLSLPQPNILYDPTTTTVVNNVTTRSTCGPVICNNVITNPSYFSAVAVKINPYFPTPNVNQGSVFNNYISSTVNPTAVNQWGLHGDYNIDERNRLSVLHAYGENTSPNIAAIPPPLGGGNQPSYNHTENIRINYNLSVKPSIANHAAVLAYNYWGNGTELVTPYGGKSDWVDYLGLKGFAPNFKTQFPVIGIAGTGGFGGGGSESVGNTHSVEFADTLTWITGKHTFKYGIEYLKSATNNVSPYGNDGSFNFSNTELGVPSDPASGVGFASYMLGLADSYQASHYTTPTYARNSYFAAFAQDDFKVTRKLTLNLGLRWDLFTPDVNKYYKKSWVNMTLANPGSPGVLGALEFASPADPSGVNTYYRNFSPRIGLAYSINDKTVLRAAYGIFYAQGNGNSLDSGLLTQGYNGTVGADSPDNGFTPAFHWDTDTAVPYTPTLSPQTLIGQRPWNLVRTDGYSPYQNNVIVGIQRQLPGQIVLTVSYVGNTGIHLPSRLMPTSQMPPQYLPLGANMINGTPELFTPVSDPTVQQIPAIAAMPLDPATGNHSPFPGFEALWALSGNGTAGKALSLEPQYQKIWTGWEGVGTSTYSALQIKAEKRFSNGLTLLVSYAWSKTLTNGGALSSVFSSEFGANDVWNSKSQKAYSFEDIPNLASIAYIYDLPVGRGRRFLNHGGVANQIIGGWKISGIHAYQGGRPQNIEAPVTTGSLEGTAFNTPDQIPGVPMASAADRSGHFDPAVDSQFNNAAFAFPCAFCFGTLTPTEGRVRDFPYFDEDFSLIKEWEFHESWKLDFRADLVNALNRVQFGDNAGGYASEPVFGYPGFGMVGNQENIPRVIQFGLRLKW